ncbi:DUF3990 domain-containing protein [Virgibacillus necropolis]|uniref:DUF3990 domain-containing protein n=1 Tax=Virgibacillus necropolis TaxID=163877 RepID=UPI00384D81D1
MFPYKEKETYTVYHGTNLFAAKVIQYHSIRLDVQRQLTDFGKGFYVTFNLSQAKSWGQVRARHSQVSVKILQKLGISKAQYFHHPDTRTPAYIAFHLNLKKLKYLHGMLFPLPHEPEWHHYERLWKEFVQSCRNGKKHSYDYVYGAVGSGHITNPNLIKFSSMKEQLSLNTPKAIDCLMDTQVMTFKPGNKVLTNPFHEPINNVWRTNKETLFLSEIREKVMTIGRLSRKEADQIVNRSHFIPSFTPIMMHEPPSYWAFSILYGSSELWHENYELNRGRI